MAALVVVGVVFTIFAIGFICAPLVRSEDEIRPLYRSRPGVRHLYGPTGDEISDADYGPLPEKGRVRCRHCGTVNDATYDYCEECLGSLA